MKKKINKPEYEHKQAGRKYLEWIHPGQGKGGKRLFYFYFNVVGFIVAQGQRSAHDPQGNGIVQGSPLFDGDCRSGYEPHFPDATSQFTAHLDGGDSTALVDVHGAKVDTGHITVSTERGKMCRWAFFFAGGGSRQAGSR